MKRAAVIGTIVSAAVAYDPRGMSSNEYLFNKVNLKDCDVKNDGCTLAKVYENNVGFGTPQFEQMMKMAFDRCLAESGPTCQIDVEVTAKIRSRRHCTTEEGISLYIPELRGWTMSRTILPDGLQIEGERCEMVVGIHTSLEEGETKPTCNMRDPMQNTGHLAWGLWSVKKKEFALTFDQPVDQDLFQLMPNGSGPGCKYHSTNETNYSIKFFKQMRSDKKGN